MDKKQFINRIYKKFEGSFTADEESAERRIYIEDCNKILPESGADYKKLYDLVLTGYKYKTAPTTHWLSTNLQKCRVYEVQNCNDEIGSIKCLVNSYPYEFSYLRRESTIKQALDGLREITAKREQKLVILSDIGDL